MLRNTAWVTLAVIGLCVTAGCHCGRMGYYGYPYGPAYGSWNAYSLTGYSQQAAATAGTGAPFQCRCEPLNAVALTPQPDRGPQAARPRSSDARQPAAAPRARQPQFQQTSASPQTQQTPTGGWRLASDAPARPGGEAGYRTVGDTGGHGGSSGPVLTGYIGPPHGSGCSSCAVPAPQPTPQPQPGCAVPPAAPQGCAHCGVPPTTCASCAAPPVGESCSHCAAPHPADCSTCAEPAAEGCSGCGVPGEIVEGEIVPGYGGTSCSGCAGGTMEGCSGCGGVVEGCSGCGGVVEGCSGCGGTIESSPTCSICGGSHATFSGKIETFQPSGPVSPAPPAEGEKPSEAKPRYEPDTDVPQPPTAKQMQWVPRQSL